MNEHVVLIANDQRLGAILTMALADRDRLAIIHSPRELPDPREREIGAVVLDLPAGSRRGAYDEVRRRFQGRLLVPVETEKDTSGWPPDPNRRFLVRPFQFSDLIAGVRGTDDPGQGADPGRRAVRVRVVRAVALGIVVLLLGIAAGMLLEPDRRPTQASQPPAPAPVPRERVVTRVGPAPAPCTTAIDNANAAISYLINKIRDERLTRSLSQFTVNGRACRAMGR
jgi:hypothetical protein